MTDPESPASVRLEQMAKEKWSEYTVHVILSPLSTHRKAPLMIEWIMQGSTDEVKRKRMEAIMLRGSKAYEMYRPKNRKAFTYSKEVATKVSKAQEAVKVLATSTTPSLYDAQFGKISWSSLWGSSNKTVKQPIPKKK